MAEDGEKPHGRKSIQGHRLTSEVDARTISGTEEYDQVVRPKEYRTPPYGRARSANLTARTNRTDSRKKYVVQAKLYRPHSCETSEKQPPHVRNNENDFSKEVKGTPDTGSGNVNEKRNAIGRKPHSKRVWDNTTLNRYFLENLLKQTPESIGKVFSNRYEDFVQVMKKCSKDGYVINVLLRLFGKIASTSSESIITLNGALHESLFIENNVVSYLLSLLGSACENSDAVRNTLHLITCMANNSVNSIFLGFYSVLTVLSELVEEIRASEFYSHKMQAEIEDFDNIRSQIMTIRRRTEKKKKTKEDMYRPPDDFRTISVVPTATELLTNKQPFLRKNKAYGSFNDIEHYLDVQFRLLREDYIAPLRESIHEYKINFQEIQQGTKRIRDIRVYSGVHIAGTTVTADGIGQLLTFDTSSTQRVNWEHSKRLNYGSLLCLSHDKFNTIWFAIVTNREVEDLELGIVEVQFTCGIKPLFNIADKEFIMAESDTYFEAYKHNLTALQTIKKLPFCRYIVNCQEHIDIPKYLTENENCTYNLSLLANDNIRLLISRFGTTEILCKTEENAENFQKSREFAVKISQIKQDPALQTVKILTETGWPDPSSVGLDESQFRAVKNAVTHEFSITQGPPGTGKTYVGLKIARALLANKNMWSGRNNLQPMLIVCYTNHALDQFLCGFHDFFGGNIVRVGGRSSSELMQQHGIRTMYKHISDQVMEESSVLRTIKDKTRDRIDEIKNQLFMADTRLLNEYQLGKYIGRLYHSLTFGFQLQVFRINRRRSKERQLHPNHFDVVEEWLGRGRLIQRSNYQICFRCTASNIQAFKADKLQNTENKGNTINVCHTSKDDQDYFYNQIGCMSKDLLKKTQAAAVDRTKDKKSKKRKGAQNETLAYYDDISSATDSYQMKIQDVWTVPVPQRWKLYKRWTEDYSSELKEKLKEYEENYEITCRQMKENTKEKNSLALRQADVVGMTTTGAAKHFDILQTVKPKIVIVEEAAEVFEAHIVTSLSEKCEHLILIGDHKQLKPSPAVYKLAKKFNLDISLFERMINNKVNYECLEFQHRMRPEISKLIRLFYPTLKDDASVFHRPNIRGVESNVFFVSHTDPEVADADNTSHSNEHEAQFLVSFCRYLLKQQYDPSQITVLTTYSAQMFLLRKLMQEDSEFHGVNVTVVDNYQGEENDIILLSLVRSNPEEKIGFLKTENRVNVALSRARNGLFVIGIFATMSKVSEVWSGLLKLLKEEGQIGPSLPLFCRNHRNNKLFASTAEDFLQAPEGGCFENCDARLDCGHVCRLKCHVYDTSHEMYQCTAPCNKTCLNNHTCVDLCFEICSNCKVKIPKKISRCGHVQKIPCYKDPDDWRCQVPCEDTLKCGHKCQAKCHEEDHICHKKIKISFKSCGHVMEVDCYKRSETTRCELPCKFLLPCKHKCAERCHQPHTSICQIKVTKTLKCGHPVEARCHKEPDTVTCPFPCEEKLACGHRCQSNCGASHTLFCEEHVTKELKCGHLLPLFCGEESDTVKCPIKCRKKLECGHKCEEKCSDPHTTKCQVFVPYTCANGHKNKKQCHLVFRQSEVECTAPCQRRLACGHPCRGTCFECENGRIHKPCLMCGLPDKSRHRETVGRSRKLPCVAPCRNQCSHRKCNNMCFEPCAADKTTNWPCQEKCEWSCEHKTCSKKCYEMCDRSVCTEPCNKPLAKYSLSSRTCQGYCGETCGVDRLHSSIRGRTLRLGSALILSGERKHFHKFCGKEMTISGLKEYNVRNANLCGPVCRNCMQPVLMDENIYGNTVKELHEHIEKEKLHSEFYERHVEIQELFTHVKLKLKLVEPENRDLRSFEKTLKKRQRSFEEFLHSQSQGFADLKNELHRLAKLAEGMIAKEKHISRDSKTEDMIEYRRLVHSNLHCN